MIRIPPRIELEIGPNLRAILSMALASALLAVFAGMVVSVRLLL